MTETVAAASDLRPEPGNVKGSAFREFVAWYQQENGQSALDAVYQDLDSADQVHFQPEREALGIIASFWYPAPAVHALVDGMLKASAGSRDEWEEMARKAGESTIDGLMTGVYRMIFRLLISPKLYGRNIQMLWSRVHSSGKITVEEVEPRVHRGTISQWWDHHPFLCRAITYSKEPMYRAMGCSNARVEIESCVANGDESCVSIIRWD